MKRLNLLFTVAFCAVLMSCKNTTNSDIIRNDLLKEIRGFIKYSEENAGKYGKKVGDTNIYWIQFFEKNDRNVVVIMQQPFIHKTDLDGFVKINDNSVFFYYSDNNFVDVAKLEKSVGNEFPDRNSIEAGLGFSAPNWAYYINDDGLEKFELGQ
ncbi:MAG: hypothetical protein AAGA43_13420 [Bacteroidota bacterium]